MGFGWYYAGVPKEPRWTDYPARAELHAIYAEVDALLAPYSCEGSVECCDFAITGREPLPTTVELVEVLHAAKAIGGLPKKRLPLVKDSRRCAFLSDENRCRIYASRPFGCRTYFCHRIVGPGKLPRAEIQALSRRVTALAERAFPRDPLPRPLMRSLGQELREVIARSK